MTAKRTRSVLAGRTATVAVERCGAMIRIEEVPAAQAGIVLADILSAFRLLAKKYPELVPDLDPIPGAGPVDVTEDEYADESRRKRVGFQV